MCLASIISHLISLNLLPKCVLPKGKGSRLHIPCSVQQSYPNHLAKPLPSCVPVVLHSYTFQLHLRKPDYKIIIFDTTFILQGTYTFHSTRVLFSSHIHRIILKILHALDNVLGAEKATFTSYLLATFFKLCDNLCTYGNTTGLLASRWLAPA